MMDIEDKSKEALSIHELAEASKDGFDVSTCLVCNRPTLWRKGTYFDVATCGRQACMQEYEKIVRDK